MSRGTLRITHSAVDGTMLEGSSKGDGAWDVIKEAQAGYKLRGWKYFPSIRAIGVRNSRDRAPDLFNIEATAALLRAAGFEVAVEVDAAPPAMDDAEGRRAERMDDRADALHAKAERLGAEAESRAQIAHDMAQTMNGQPIQMGHHSQRRHQRDAARAEGHMRKSIELADAAEGAENRAATAEKHMAHREDPRRVMRRLETLRADLRRAQRGLDGYTRQFRDGRGEVFYVEDHKAAVGTHRQQLEVDKAHLETQIAYWQAFLDKEIADGRFSPVVLADIKPGDLIKYWGGWRKVVKVNRVTVSVESGYSWADKVKVDDIHGHKPAAEVAPLDLDEVAK